MKQKDYLNKLLERVNFKDSKTIEQAKEIVEIGNEYMNMILNN